jgi:hypothetical protein
VYQVVHRDHPGEVRGAVLQRVCFRLIAGVLNADLRSREQPKFRLVGRLDVDERYRDWFEGVERGLGGHVGTSDVCAPMTDRTVEVAAGQRVKAI